MHPSLLRKLSLVLLATTPASARLSINRPTRGHGLHHTPMTLSETAAERLIRSGIASGACDKAWRPPHNGSAIVHEQGKEADGTSRCWKDRWFEQLTGILDEWEDGGDAAFSKLS